jgi:nitrogen fixation protein FixH
MISVAKPFQLTGLHVLFMVGGFFLVVIVVDLGFVTMALKTFPGEVSATPYEDGLAYDRTLAARARQAALGWTAEVEADGAPGRVRLRLTDADAKPLDGLVVTGGLQRPATLAGAQKLTFRGLGRGLYAARAPAGGGAWDLAMTARDAQGRSFEAERRIVWP